PYAKSAGILSRRTPPGFMPGIPSCQPLMSRFSENVTGSLSPFSVVSNTFPSVSHPVYRIVTVSPALTSAPFPSTTSHTSRPLSFFCHSLASSLGNSHRLPSVFSSLVGGGYAAAVRAAAPTTTNATNRVMAGSGLRGGNQFDLEDEGGVGRDGARDAA